MFSQLDDLTPLGWVAAVLALVLAIGGLVFKWPLGGRMFLITVVLVAVVTVDLVGYI